MQGKKYFGLIAVVAMMACNSSNQSTETKDSTTIAVADTVNVTALNFKDEKLQNIYMAYIKLKDQLIATKFEQAIPAAKELVETLTGFKGCENAVAIARKIAEAKDIKTQRAEFTGLNIELIPIFKQAELSAGIIYVQHCPMANNGDGGDWLASEKKIQNPYYGDEMMECGRIAEEIKAKL